MANEEYVFDAKLLMSTNGAAFVKEVRGIFNDINAESQRLLASQTKTGASGIAPLYTSALGQVQALTVSKVDTGALTRLQQQQVEATLRRAELQFGRAQVTGAAQDTPVGNLGNLAQAQQRGRALIDAALAEQNRQLLAQRAAADAAERKAAAEKTAADNETKAAEASSQKARLTQQQLDEQRRLAGVKQRQPLDPKPAQQAGIIQALSQQGSYISGAELGDAVKLQAAEIRTETATRRAGSEAYLKAQADAALAEKQLAIAVARTTREQAIAQGGEGTFFQRIQAQIHGRQNQTDTRTPEDFQTFGQFFTSKALTTVGFALSAGVLYGAINGFKEIISEASSLQRQLAIVKSQFDELGDSKGFDNFSQKVVDISVQTGIAADQVALVARQLAGVFRVDTTGLPDFNKALSETEQALKLSQVTGLPLQEITDSLTSLTTTFGASFTKIGDTAIGLERRFGVLAPQIIEFTADLAPVAKQLGFTVDQVEALGAIAQQRSGVAGSALAESFNRALPAIQQTQAGLAQLLGQSSKTEQFITPIISALSAGNGPEVIKQLVGAYQQMSTAQQQALGELLGGQRNAKAFFAVLQAGPDTIAALDGKLGDFSGSLDARFKDFQSTVEFAFEQARRSLEQFGLALFNSGIADGLKFIADAAGLLINVASQLLKLFSSFNDVLGGLPVKLLAVYAALRLITALGGGVSGLLAIVRGVTGRGTGGAPGQGTLPFAAETLPPLFPTVGKVVPGVGTGVEATGIKGALSSAATTLAPAVIVASVAAVAQKVASVRDQTAAAIDNFDKAVADKLKSGITPEQILSQVNQSGGGSSASVLDQILNLGKETNPEQEALNEIQRQNADRQSKELDAILTGSDEAHRKALADFLYSQTKGGGGGGLTITTAKDLEKKGGLEKFVKDFLSDPANNERNDAIARLIQFARSGGASPEVIATLDQIAQEYENNLKQTNAQQAVADYAPVLEEIKARFQTGDASLAQVVASEKENIRIIQKALDASSGASRGQIAQQLATAQKDLDDTLTQAANRIADVQVKFAGLSGGDTAIATAQAKIQAFHSLAAGGASDDVQLNAALDALDALQKQFDEFVNSPVIVNGIARAPTAAEKLARAAKGIQIPPDLRRAIIKLQLSTSDIGSALKVASASSGQDFNTLLNQLADAIQNSDAQGIDGLKTLVGNEITKLQGLRQFITRLGESTAQIDDSIKTLYDGLAALNKPLTKVDPGPTVQGSNQQQLADQAAIDAATEAKAYADAIIAQQRARAHGDPIAVAYAGIQAANNAIRFSTKPSERAAAVAQLIEAQNALADAEAARVDAFIQLGEAMTSDPILKGQFELARANAALANAHGAQQQYEALIRQVESQRTLQEAIVDVFRSQQELVAAIADAAGDVVGAAQAQLAIAQANLKELMDRAAAGDNPGDAAINRARSQVVAAQAAVRDAQLRSREDSIDTALQLEKITTQQAISQFEALLQIPNLTAEQTNEILLKIKQLQGQLNQDLQFDIPDGIKLPTIYQVKRLVGADTPAGPGTYQDNRQISILPNATINASNPADVQKAVDTIHAAITAPPRNGTYQNPIAGAGG